MEPIGVHVHRVQDEVERAVSGDARQVARGGRKAVAASVLTSQLR